MTDDDDLNDQTVIKRRRPRSEAPPPEDVADDTAARGSQARLVAPPGAEEAPDDGLLDTAAPGSVPAAAGQAGDGLIGHVLKGQYRVVRRLGEGGMGSVYLAHNLQFDEKVAVKFLDLPPGGDSHNMLARFRAEQETLRLLREARIVKTRGDGVTDDGRPFIVMELVDGTPLDDILEEALKAAEGILPEDPHEAMVAPERVLRIMIDVSIALEEAHAHQIIHRDLKPANLVVERSTGGFETTKVLDFGIAKATNPVVSSSEVAPPTATGMIIGTVAYLSPEQANSVEVVPQSDLYSLGATAYHCLTGHLPFTGPPMTVLHDHVNRPARSFAAVAPGLIHSPLLDALEGIVLRLLEKRPEDRYLSASALRQDLERLLGLSSVPQALLEAPDVAASEAVTEGREGSAASDDDPSAPPEVRIGSAPTPVDDTAASAEPAEAALAEPPLPEPSASGAPATERDVALVEATMMRSPPPSSGRGLAPILLGGLVLAGIGGAIAMSSESESTPSKAVGAKSVEPVAAKAGPAPAREEATPTPADAGVAVAPRVARPPPAAPPPAKPRIEARSPTVEVVRAPLVTDGEVRSIRRAALDCARRTKVKKTHTVRLGGTARVVVQSIQPAHAALRKCLTGRMPIEKFEGIGGAMELKVRGSGR